MVEQKTSFSHVFSLKEPLSSLKYKCDIVFSVFKKEVHNVYSEEINKIALSSNDNKRLQTFDRNTLHPHGTSDAKVCKTEFLELLNIK